MASAAEAELAALFMNAQIIMPLRTMCEELGHPQPPTPIRTDNSTAKGIVHETIKQKRSKAIDMQFYWLRDRQKQNQIDIYWQPGTTNAGDFFTKYHPQAHHKQVRPIYTYMKGVSPNTLQGCVELLARSTNKPARTRQSNGKI